jgi:hypothetical protein
MYTANLYQMELDRIRYGVTKYIRTRLHKIEQDVFYIVQHSKDMMARARLSGRCALLLGDACVCASLWLVRLARPVSAFAFGDGRRHKQRGHARASAPQRQVRAEPACIVMAR